MSDLLVSNEISWENCFPWTHLKTANCSVLFKDLLSREFNEHQPEVTSWLLKLFHPVNSPGFSMTHINCPQKNRFTFHHTDSAVALVSPLASHQMWKEEVLKGSLKVKNAGSPIVQCLFSKQLPRALGYRLCGFLRTAHDLMKGQPAPSVKKHWENTENLFGVMTDYKINRTQEC